MNPWHAILLGIVQGIGEFAPISSSGHLIVLPWLLGWQKDQGLAFDVALHFGTLLALLTYFAADLVRMLRDYFSRWRLPGGFWPAQRQYLLPLIFGCFPAALAGFFMEDLVESKLRSPGLVAALMAGMGLVLYLADRLGKKTKPLAETRPMDWLTVGVSQALALFPGVSRSGITITAGLAVGMRREAAARFSFLLSIPIVAGASAMAARKMLHSGVPADERAAFIVGILTAAVFGYICIKFLLVYLRTRSVNVFVWYRLAFAAVVAVTLLLKV